MSVHEIQGVAMQRADSAGKAADSVFVTVREGQTFVHIGMRGYAEPMSPDEARRLARSLYRVARRIDARGGQ